MIDRGLVPKGLNIKVTNLDACVHVCVSMCECEYAYVCDFYVGPLHGVQASLLG